MAKQKSLIVNMSITVAQRQHRCRHSASHVIEKGQKRLTIRVDRSNQNYCLVCAQKFLETDIQRLTDLLTLVRQS